jgi:hypothetical protein
MPEGPERVLFRVLGPFEVVIDGSLVPLGGARQRLVLAGLVANANAVVSSDRLIDIVWGDEPPSTALSTLQKYVHRLRALLGDRILTRPPGYVLRVDVGESDSSRFESLLVDATQLTTAGELSDAIGMGTATVVLRDGEIAGYATGIGYGMHAVAEDLGDLQALIGSAERFLGLGFLLPSRDAAMLRWCLEHGLRIVQQSTLMTMGLYNEPSARWLPSVVY